MKTFFKVVGIIAGSAFVIGGVIMIVGLCMGGRWAQAKDIAFKDFNFGGRYADIEDSDYEYSDSYDSVDSLDFDISLGEVIIKAGTDFSFAGTDLLEDAFQSYVENGVWHIKYGKNKHWGWFGFWDFRGSVHSKMVITVPESMLEEVTLSIGAGSGEVSDLSAKKLYLSVGAGSLSGERVIAEEKGRLEAGAGQIKIKQLSGENIDVECGVGEVEIDGAITGRSSVDCGMGEIKLRLAGMESDYSYTVDAGIGKVSIGDSHSYTSVHKSIKNTGADNSFSLDCGIGSISLSFQ